MFCLDRHTSLPTYKIGTKSCLSEPGMSLKTILTAKGGSIICIEPTADLAAAAKLLSRHRIGALVVLDAGDGLVGILSERDIMRTMADVGSAVLQMSVEEVMTRNVSTCDVSDPINSVMDRMTKGRFRHMPVLEKDRLAGLVSMRR
jgi:CBS domain-containing protein